MGFENTHPRQDPPPTGLRQAIVLSAGLGTRMQPLTLTRPKPLIAVDGKALLDYALDTAFRSGIETCVVNVHYLADQIEDHVAAHYGDRVFLSDERERLLDSGGGVAKALERLDPNEPTLLLNADSFWLDRNSATIAALAAAFDQDRMDFLLLLAKRDEAVGFSGKGDFFADGDHRITRRGEHASAPYVYTGAAVFHPRLFEGRAGTAFSLNSLFDQAIADNRLFGALLDGLWLHVGTPDAIAEAETAMANFRAKLLTTNETRNEDQKAHAP
ncbi:MAG: nucleotidyltransferase family protein [Pseudomonadota bacterium]